MNDKARINLIVSHDVKARIDRLILQSEGGSITSVIKRALLLLDALVEIEAKGGRILIETAEGEQQRVLLL